MRTDFTLRVVVTVCIPASSPAVADLFLQSLIDLTFDFTAFAEDILNLPSPSGVLSAFVELHDGLGLACGLAQLINGHAFDKGRLGSSEFFVFGTDGLYLVIDGSGHNLLLSTMGVA